MSRESEQPIRVTSVGEGPVAVVFIHGFLDAGAIWDPVIAASKFPGVEKVSFDLPGMGGDAAAAGPFSYARYTDHVEAVVRDLDRPVVLVGQSMGSVVAQLYADRHPAKVRGLVLVTPVPVGGVQGPPEAIDPFRKLGGQPEAQRQTRKYLAPGIDAVKLEQLGRLGDVVAPATATALVNTWNDGEPGASVPSAFQGPVLVVRGADDPLVVEALANATAARFAHASVVAVPDAGHWAHFEQPVAVAKLVDGLLASALGGAPAADWKGAFAEKKQSDFAATLAENVVFEASVMKRTVTGRAAVSEILGNASALYETLVFTEQASSGPRQYVEWKARTFGGPELAGITILTRDADGLIAAIAIHHRPLDGLLDFSEKLGRRLAQSTNRDVHDLFATGALR